MAVRRQLRRIGAKPHRPAHVGVDAARLQTLRAHPFGDQADDRFVGRAELGARRLVDAARVPRRLDARHLHTETYPEKGHVPFTRKADAGDLAFRSALAEAAGAEDAVNRVEPGDELLFASLDPFGVETAGVTLYTVPHSAVAQPPIQRFISVWQRAK